MTVLSLKNICKSFGAEQILSDVSFSLQDDTRMGLVGSNGAGKTTLLKIICGQTGRDAGTVNMPSGLRVGYLAQEADISSSETVWALMRSVFDEAFALEEKMRSLEEDMAHAADDAALWRRISAEYERVTQAFERAGGWGYKSAIKGVLTGLGLGADVYERQVDTLSGGQRSRLFLARLLLEKPGLLLLDEPTNHLDADAIGWLEGYLKQWAGAIVVVSHDRWLLDQLCEMMVSLEECSASVYGGNYTSFVAQREERRAQMIKAYEQNQSERLRQKQMIERYQVWGRIGGGKNFIKANAKKKALEKMENLERVGGERAKMSLNLGSAGRGGNDVLLAENLAMGFDDLPLFDGLDIDMKKGDRAALVGANGIGKTTLLRIIAGKLAPTAGSVKLGAGVKIGFYDQMQEGLDPRLSMIEQMREVYPQMDDGLIRNMLAGFLFYGDDVFKPISALSGGEKGRLSLLILMLGQGNLLLLDEPTNHLDMDSCEVLENALLGFDGTVLFVSHDRYFINKIANRVLEMKQSGVTQFGGSWGEYMAHLEKLKTGEPEYGDGQTKTQIAKDKRARRDEELRQREAKRRVKQIEKDIASREVKLEQIEAELENPHGMDEQALHALARQHEDVQTQIDALMQQWERAHGGH